MCIIEFLRQSSACVTDSAVNLARKERFLSGVYDWMLNQISSFDDGQG